MSTKIKSSNLSLNAFNEIDRRITDLIDSAYVNARVSTVDSAQVQAIIDSAYLQGIIDSDYVTSRANANITSFALFEHSNTISANYTITAGNNAITGGPITIADGINVTVPDSSTWTIL